MSRDYETDGQIVLLAKSNLILKGCQDFTPSSSSLDAHVLSPCNFPTHIIPFYGMCVLEVDLAVVSKMEETDGSNHGNTLH